MCVTYLTRGRDRRRRRGVRDGVLVETLAVTVTRPHNDTLDLCHDGLDDYAIAWVSYGEVLLQEGE